MPVCQNGSTTGGGPPSSWTSQSIFPRPHLRRPSSPCFSSGGETRPSGNMCSQSPTLTRSAIVRITAWLTPPPRLIGTVFPAAKNLCVHGPLAQISLVHIVHRIPPCSRSVAKYAGGMSALSTPGSSNVDAWLLTVISPRGRSRFVMLSRSAS
eukprot:29040-Pelagococcus_subviridis.AAC.2